MLCYLLGLVKVILIILIMQMVVFSQAVFDVTQITVNDDGTTTGDVVIVEQPYNTSVINTTGNLNLIGFVADGLTYSADDYVAGLSPSSVIGPGTLDAVLSPNDFLSGTDAPAFFVGDGTDMSEFLVSGERGLSFSTGLNFKASDNAAVLEFDVEFLSDPTATSRPTFIVGDGADNQTPDLWEFLDEDKNTLFSFVLDENDYSRFGDQTIDRVKTDLSGYVGDANGRDLGLGLAAFSITQQDLNGADWAEVRGLRLHVPQSGSNPKTDYSFIGVDIDVVKVVPEPSTTLLIGLGVLSVLVRRTRD